MDVQSVSWVRFCEIVKSADQILVFHHKHFDDGEHKFCTYLDTFSDPNELQFVETDSDEFFVIPKQTPEFSNGTYLCSSGDSDLKLVFNKITTTPILP